RCGVAHSYISKGSALLSSDNNDEKKHLNYYEDGLFIYVPELADDVSKAIRLLYEDIKKNNNDLKKKYNFIIEKLNNDGKKVFDDFVKKNNKIKIKETIKRDIITEI
ncbi:MAG: hypothetical protein Q8M94_13905, partial [Ignavibacteria bacterium]|nr:hypothetical protein [Ignavibacteria bacterium]